MKKTLNAISTFHYEEAKLSAQILVPFIIKLVKPNSVIDVGCGDGTWLSVFAKNKVKDILGIDAEYIDKNKLKIPKDKFISKDLTKAFMLDKKFDLIVSLEVGEHLPDNSAKDFIKSLTLLGPVVLFSAAIPFQGGHKHINEQWPNYWYDLFKNNGYIAIDCVRSKFWNDKNLQPWYAQNTIVYIKKNLLNNYPLLKKNVCKNQFTSHVISSSEDIFKSISDGDFKTKTKAKTK